MDNQFNEELARISAEALSTLGFMFPAGDPDPALKVPGEDAPAVTVTFHGPIHGSLDLKVSADLLPVLAANMTGSDSPPSEPEQWDALGEMLNIICGNMLPLLTDAKAVYDVAAPRRCRGTPDHAGQRLVGSTGLPMEVGQVELALYVNEPVAVA